MNSEGHEEGGPMEKIIDQKEFVEAVADAYPKMSQRQIGYILGMADAMTDRKKQQEEKETVAAAAEG